LLVSVFFSSSAIENRDFRVQLRAAGPTSLQGHANDTGANASWFFAEAIETEEFSPDHESECPSFFGWRCEGDSTQSEIEVLDQGPPSSLGLTLLSPRAPPSV